MNYILNKERFVDIIEKIKKIDGFYEGIDSVISENNIDGYLIWPTASGIVISLLEDMFQDEAGWISYFCFELGYGKYYKEGTIYDNEGNIIPLSTAAELYDFLMSNLKMYEDSGGE